MTKLPETTVAQLKAAYGKIAAARDIVLATHENPDADGIGAMLAFALYLNAARKRVTVWGSGMIPRHLSFLPGFPLLTERFPKRLPDLVVAFDYGSRVRLRLEKVGAEHIPLIGFDHHPPDNAHHTEDENTLALVDVSFSSSSEMAYYFFVTNDIAITQDMATCLYAGIVHDTGGFSHSNTSPRTFAAASALAALGVDIERAAKRLLGLPSYAAAHVAGLALSRMTLDKATGVAYSYLGPDDLAATGTTWDDADTIVHLMNDINAPEVSCIILFKNRGTGVISASFRSDAERRFDARKLAQIFGGGGHVYAAGAKIEGELHEVIASVLDQAKRGNFAV